MVQGARAIPAMRPAHRPATRTRTQAVPTLFRFLAVLVILAGVGFAAVYALATFVQPTPREISVTVPAAKLQPPGR